ncbi:protein arginine N-methyltransferase, putative [Entamoeba invadens IP1]|uniref:type I protein arginine methyltransferase n=1 Tax=Entamoeba invadens IP1 TaxID=370355 RepID=A0A0A1UH33_ENTIV|nr:protein arginine N-methyltransferase, putative [Entamoeba invadens IP1]ELP94588.1 protein arginine N-methyltransferase, putative [Entamoeba invadens IP1]|eukprot:XP_004261359.1 protein arginine N-methyltransferase, putative [Entamoeba invadens IP1]
MAVEESAMGDSQYYWISYSHTNIHEEMINDEHRTKTYKEAIEYYCKDKVVLDVGCGTGILSLFAAQAGAKKVYAIEMSDIAGFAAYIVRHNNYEKVIQVIQGRVEDIEVPEKVDIIVSEWMGYNLLFEGMLSSVLTARRFLKEERKEPVMLPNKCHLFICGIEGNEEYITKRKTFCELYGDMDLTENLPLMEAVIKDIKENRVVTTRTVVADLNLETMVGDEVNFSAPFEITVTRKTEMSGFCCYFDCFFDHHSILTTQPGQSTHWKQTLFFLKYPLKMEMGDRIGGIYVCKQNATNQRNLDISINFSKNNVLYQMNYFLN